MTSSGGDLVGRTLAGRYRLLRLVGEGGIGQVYEAEQLGLGRHVAVKVLRVQNALTIARFRKEARAAGKLRHPNVVSVLDFLTPEGEPPILVMELLEGESLAALGRREAPLSPKRAVDLAIQILSGLSAAHAEGIVHRDVKPGNVWVAKTLAGTMVKLLDFGLVLSEDTRLTKTGETIGTPSFQAPEQLRGGTVDARADIHAVGVVLYMLLSGRLPWTDSAAPHGEILGKVPRPLADMVPGLSRDLSLVVDKALAKAPGDRFASAAEMVEALAPFAGRSPRIEPSSEPAPPPPPRTARRARRSSVVFFAAMGGAMVLALAVLAFATWQRASSRRGVPPTSTTASPTTLALPDVTTPGEAEDADVVPVVTPADVTPDASGDTQAAPRTPPRPREALRFSTDADRTVCECFADISPGHNRHIGRPVCAIPKPPRCRCVVRDHSMTLCAQPRDESRVCPDRDDLYGAAREGETCHGRTPSGSEEEGVVACDRCYPPRTYVGATPGTPCRGVHDGRHQWEGVWRCTTR